MQSNTHKDNKPEETLVAVVVVVVLDPPMAELVDAADRDVLSSPTLERTANILPSFVRM